MVRKISGPAVTRPQRALKTVFAAVGALALALPLAACGRKGALDPPPGGYALDQSSMRTPVSRQGAAPPKDHPANEPGYDAQGHPIAPAGPKKRLPADWLLD
jgi:predicted small lipoprotein YifL